MLEKNAPKTRTPFKRKQVFLVASFNDWIPVEMKSIHEIKTIKSQGENLANYLKENQSARAAANGS